jgi:hypothetical protein
MRICKAIAPEGIVATDFQLALCSIRTVVEDRPARVAIAP